MRSDVIVVGAGFAGLYMPHKLRQLGFGARAYESEYGVGGTWYRNRYPGARCDAQSLAYSYTFDEAVEHEWRWSERYATQPEILRYLNFIADRLGLRKDIQFGSRVDAATFDDSANRWVVRRIRHHRVRHGVRCDDRSVGAHRHPRFVPMCPASRASSCLTSAASPCIGTDAMRSPAPITADSDCPLPPR